MSNLFGLYANWKYISKKGRLMILFGLLSLILIIIGVVILLVGVLLLFTIVGVPNPNSGPIIQIMITGFVVIIIGVIAMILYMIGMSFIPPPVLPNQET
ncbi:MAG: hypothetical protein ACFFDT_25645 [Candidatus Hodarchaeota archaeon]